MTDRPVSLDIKTGSTYLSEQEAIARDRKNGLAWPVAILWTVTGIVALGQVFFLVDSGHQSGLFRRHWSPARCFAGSDLALPGD